MITWVEGSLDPLGIEIMKNLFLIALLAISVGLVGCSSSTPTTNASVTADANELMKKSAGTPVHPPDPRLKQWGK